MTPATCPLTESGHPADTVTRCGEVLAFVRESLDAAMACGQGLDLSEPAGQGLCLILDDVARSLASVKHS